MTNIDFDRVITSEQLAADASAARVAAIKTECTSRITTYMDMHTVMNLQGAVLSGALTSEQMSVFTAAQGWVRAMQVACRAAIMTGADPDWPAVPDGVALLAAEF